MMTIQAKCEAENWIDKINSYRELEVLAGKFMTTVELGSFVAYLEFYDGSRLVMDLLDNKNIKAQRV